MGAIFRRDAIAADEESQYDSFETISLNKPDLELDADDNDSTKVSEKELPVIFYQLSHLKF